MSLGASYLSPSPNQETVEPIEIISSLPAVACAKFAIRSLQQMNVKRRENQWVLVDSLRVGVEGTHYDRTSGHHQPGGYRGVPSFPEVFRRESVSIIGLRTKIDRSGTNKRLSGLIGSGLVTNRLPESGCYVLNWYRKCFHQVTDMVKIHAFTRTNTLFLASIRANTTLFGLGVCKVCKRLCS
jgi:hypothetical protein